MQLGCTGYAGIPVIIQACVRWATCVGCHPLDWPAELNRRLMNVRPPRHHAATAIPKRSSNDSSHTCIPSQLSQRLFSTEKRLSLLMNLGNLTREKFKQHTSFFPRKSWVESRCRVCVPFSAILNISSEVGYGLRSRENTITITMASNGHPVKSRSDVPVGSLYRFMESFHCYYRYLGDSCTSCITDSPLGISTL